MGIIGSKSTVKQLKKTPSTESSSDSEKALELETVNLPTETLPEKDDENGEFTDSDKPITEAEKLRHLYKKEQAHGLSDGNVVKKDATKTQGRQQYKTSGYYNTGRKADSLITGDNNNNTENETVQAHEPIIGEGKEEKDKDNAGLKKNKEEDAEPNSPVISARSPAKMSPKVLRSTKEIDGSLLSNNYSQHCPGLLEQTRSHDGSLRPLLALGKLGVEKNQIRTELEKQGILTADKQAPADQIDPKQEGIIGELRKVGIIHHVTADDLYTMSNGIPKRRPPPRLSQLAQSDREPIKPTETTFGRPSAIDKLLLSKNNEKSPEASSDVPSDDNSEYFGTLGTENIGDAGKLKLKLIDAELL